MMNLLSCLFLSVCLAVGATAGCPPGTVQGLRPSDCYVFGQVDKSASWHEAQGLCAAQGGSLASVVGSIENAQLIAIPKSMGSGADAFWLGGHRNETTKQWQWIDGNAFDYTNWAKGQPQDQYSCLSISAPTAEWQSASCEAAKSFICKLRSCESPPAMVDRNCEEGSTYIEAVKKCFKALPGAADWMTTYSTCKLLNAEMVTIASSVENRALTDFLATKSISTVAIGMRNVAEVEYEDGNGDDSSDGISVAQVWTWWDGTHPFYKNWANSGPLRGKDYVAVNCAFLDVTQGGTWFNGMCSGNVHDGALLTPVCQTLPLAVP